MMQRSAAMLRLSGIFVGRQRRPWLGKASVVSAAIQRNSIATEARVRGRRGGLMCDTDARWTLSRVGDVPTSRSVGTRSRDTRHMAPPRRTRRCLCSLQLQSAASIQRPQASTRRQGYQAQLNVYFVDCAKLGRKWELFRTLPVDVATVRRHHKMLRCVGGVGLLNHATSS